LIKSKKQSNRFLFYCGKAFELKRYIHKQPKDSGYCITTNFYDFWSSYI